MGYQQYGISKELVERMRRKTKEPAVKERIKEILASITRADLQNRTKVKQLVQTLSRELDETVSPQDAERIVNFVIDQKIDPNNTFHLIRLWGIFH